MGQAIQDIDQMVELSRTLRRYASESHEGVYIDKLQRAASDLEAQVRQMSVTRLDEFMDSQWEMVLR